VSEAKIKYKTHEMAPLSVDAHFDCFYSGNIVVCAFFRYFRAVLLDVAVAVGGVFIFCTV
jgi:hypothetical protein